ncbi:MAG: hypothetical protein ACE5GX_00055 [Thermoanaerobaculia bacterium]
MKNLALALILFLGLAAAAGAAAESRNGHPDLSGSWTLNEGMSENAIDKMREMRSKGLVGRGGLGGPPGGTGRGGGLDTGSWGRGRGGRRGRGLEGDRHGPLATIDDGVDAIAIRETDDQLSITYSDNRLRILFTDGRKDKRTGPLGDVVTTAKWNRDGELVVKSKVEGRKTVEIYRLDATVDRLLVDVTLDTRMGQVTFYRTYDRAPDPKAGAPGLS